MCKTEPEAAKSKPLSEEELVAKRREIEERVAAARQLQTEAKQDKAADVTGAEAASTSEAGPSTSSAAATGPPAIPSADDEDCALPGGYETGETVFHIGEASQLVETAPADVAALGGAWPRGSPVAWAALPREHGAN